MLVDMLSLNDKLTTLEAAVSDLRQHLKNIGPRLDGIRSLVAAGQAGGRKMSLAPGYTEMSSDVGLYIPNGSIAVELSENSAVAGLRVSAETAQMLPEHIIVQLNLGAQFFRGRSHISAAASWIGKFTKPHIECRFIADGDIVRRDIAEVNVETSGFSMQTLARFEIPASVQRSESIEEARVCFLFDSEFLDSEITSLLAH